LGRLKRDGARRLVWDGIDGGQPGRTGKSFEGTRRKREGDRKCCNNHDLELFQSYNKLESLTTPRLRKLVP
jgi:hypothetical protein